MSIEGAKGSLRVEREERGRRRRKGREGRQGERERESKHSGEKAKGQMLVLPEDTRVGREDHAGREKGEASTCIKGGWPSISGLLCQRFPCLELGLEARI